MDISTYDRYTVTWIIANRQGNIKLLIRELILEPGTHDMMAFVTSENALGNYSFNHFNLARVPSTSDFRLVVLRNDEFPVFNNSAVNLGEVSLITFEKIIL